MNRRNLLSGCFGIAAALLLAPTGIAQPGLIAPAPVADGSGKQPGNGRRRQIRSGKEIKPSLPKGEAEGVADSHGSLGKRRLPRDPRLGVQVSSKKRQIRRRPLDDSGASSLAGGGSGSSTLRNPG